MDREGLKEHWDVVEAWVFDEAEVEHQDNGGTWQKTGEVPNFYKNVKYRVKPQHQTRIVWVNIYANNVVCHNTEEIANGHGQLGRLACAPVEVTWTEGEGLE